MAHEDEIAELRNAIAQQQESIRVLSATLKQVSDLQQDYMTMLADKINALQEAFSNMQR